MNERTEVLLVGKSEIGERDVATAMGFALEQVKSSLAESTYQFKKVYNKEGMHCPVENVNWTTRSWTGQVWLAYEWVKRIDGETGAGVLKVTGEIQIENFLERVKKEIEVDHRDMGLLYSPSCVAGLKLVGGGKGKETAVRTTDQFISKFHSVEELIQARGPVDQPENYRSIIDCLLNLPLLHWASKKAGDRKYREITGKYLRVAVANAIREDYSTWYTFFMNIEMGASDHGTTCQGYRSDSAWAKGRTWGVYNMALTYRCTGRKEYTEDFKHVTGYFLEYLPEDLVPYQDSEFGDDFGEPRDSFSMSITTYGMPEMMRYPEGDDAAYYTGIAKKLMKSVVDSHVVKDRAEFNGLVLHSIYFKKSPYNTYTSEGAGECNIRGDYFCMKVLMRLVGDWNPYW